MRKYRSVNENESRISSFVSDFDNLPDEEKLKFLSVFIGQLKSYGKPVLKKEIEKAVIPVGVFDSAILSSLEAIVKYLKENLGLKFSDIAAMLNRSKKTIWATYYNASKKMPSKIENPSSKITIPVSIFSMRDLSVLENVVRFIKELGYSNHEIAAMLKLDDRTIWTVFDRAKRKRAIKVEKQPQ